MSTSPSDILLVQGDNVPVAPTAGQVIFYCKTNGVFYSMGTDGVEHPFSSGGGSGTVTSVAATGSNGITVTGSPITGSGTLSFSLGAITPTSVAATGTVTGTNLSGTNTGDQTIQLTGDVTGTGTGTFVTTLATVNSNVGVFTALTVNNKGLVTSATNLSATGDATGTASGSSIALTLSTVNTNVGTFSYPTVTVDGKGRITAVSSNTPVTSFNTRTGAVTLTSSDVTTALGFTPGTGNGTVTSVSGSGGTTGLTLSGGPITTSGTLTLGGTLAIANGGTGQTTASGAINALLPSQTGNAGKYLTTDGSVVSWATVSGSGTVTSVAVSGSNGIGVAGSPITSSGTITLSLGAITPSSVNATGTIQASNIAAGATVSGANTGDQTITLTGDVTGAGNGSFATTLATVNSNVGTFTNATVTVDAKGRITSVSSGSASSGTVTSVAVSGGTTGLTVTGSPITTSGTITLAGTLNIANGGTGQTTASGAINALVPTQTGNAGLFLTTNGTAVSWAAAGTVTSVAVTGSSGVTVTGSPITSAGTINISLGTITPAAIAATGTVTGSNISGTNTGNQTITATGDATGTSTGSPATTLPLVLATVNSTPGSFTYPTLTVNGKGLITAISTNTPVTTFNTRSGAVTLTSSDVTTALGFTPGTVTSVNGSGGATGLTLTGGPITGAGTLTLGGTLAIANGGTGSTTASSAINALLPSQSGNSGFYLTTNGTVASWAPATGSGTVTSVAVSGSNGIGVSGSPITSSGTISLTLGDITPSSVAATGAVTGSNLSGTNTGDQTITLTGPVTGSGTGTFATTITPTGVTPGSYTSANVTVGADGRITSISNGSGGSGSGTVTSVAVAGTSGVSVSGSPITTSGTITVGLGDITPTSVASTGTVTGSNLSGTNSGDQTITLSGDATGTSTGAPSTSLPVTLATVNSNVGTFGDSTHIPQVTVNAKGLVTGVSSILAASVGTEKVVLRYNAGSAGSLNTTDSIVSVTSGVSATVTSTSSNTVAFTFTGYTTPPAAIFFYGQIFSSNTWTIRVPDSSVVSTLPDTSGNANSPNLITNLGSMVLSINVPQGVTGAVGAVGGRPYAIIMFKF